MTSLEPSDLKVLPAVAREAIAARLRGRPARNLHDATGPLATTAPVFVTLRRDGELRGCIGSLEPLHQDLVAEVADRARAAAFDDPRFLPLQADELRRCKIEVSVLGPLEPIETAAELDPAIYGVEVEDAHGRRAVLLPGIEGVDTVDRQLASVRRKAGIRPTAPVTLRRFRVVQVTES